MMLLCAVKGLKLNDEWWQKYWDRHRAYNEARNFFPHNYLKYTPNRPGQCKVILRLVYGMFCSRCCCRFHHTIFDAYRIRICRECMWDCNVSNVVLFREYGLSLEPIASKYRHWVRHLSLQEYRCPQDILSLSRNPLDVEYQGRRTMIFFWKPDLEKLFDLDALRVEHHARMRALRCIGASFKRKFVWASRGRYFLERVHKNEIRRITMPLTQSRNMLVGTNWSCAYLLNRDANTEAPKIDLRHAFKTQIPLPILTDDEYTIKTAVSRLRLNPETLQQKLEELTREKPLGVLVREIFKINGSK